VPRPHHGVRAHDDKLVANVALLGMRAGWLVKMRRGRKMLRELRLKGCRLRGARVVPADSVRDRDPSFPRTTTIKIEHRTFRALGLRTLPPFRRTFARKSGPTTRGAWIS